MSSQNEAHGDEGLLDITDKHREDAKSEVLEIISLYGQYPQPAREGKPIRRVEFSLSEYLADEFDASDMAAMLAGIIANCGLDQMDVISMAEKKIMAQLSDHLEDSQLVADVAEKMAQDESEEA